jgi:hypothetical protein
MKNMVDGRRQELEQHTQQVLNAFADVPKDGLGVHLRLQACMIALVKLEDRCFKMNDDPYPPLLAMLTDIKALPYFFIRSICIFNSMPKPIVRRKTIMPGQRNSSRRPGRLTIQRPIHTRSS